MKTLFIIITNVKIKSKQHLQLHLGRYNDWVDDTLIRGKMETNKRFSVGFMKVPNEAMESILSHTVQKS